GMISAVQNSMSWEDMVLRFELLTFEKYNPYNIKYTISIGRGFLMHLSQIENSDILIKQSTFQNMIITNGGSLIYAADSIYMSIMDSYFQNIDFVNTTDSASSFGNNLLFSVTGHSYLWINNCQFLSCAGLVF